MKIDYNSNLELSTTKEQEEFDKKFGITTMRLELPTVEQQIEFNKKMDRLDKQIQRERKIKYAVLKMLATPLSFIFGTLSVITKILSKISSLGVLASIYYIYKAVKKLNAGIPFWEITEWINALYFFLLPFAFMLLYFIFKKIQRKLILYT